MCLLDHRSAEMGLRHLKGRETPITVQGVEQNIQCGWTGTEWKRHVVDHPVSTTECFPCWLDGLELGL